MLTRGSLGAIRNRAARLALRTGHPRAALDLARLAVVDHEFVVAKTKNDYSLDDLGVALETLGEVEWALGGRVSACVRFRRAIELLAALPQERNVPRSLAEAREKTAACATGR